MPIDPDNLEELLWELDELNVGRLWMVHYDYFTKPERMYYMLRSLYDEVNNGGFHQFFLNSSGRCVPDAVGFLNELDATETASILQRAIDICGPGIDWKDDEQRQSRIQAVSDSDYEKLQELNDLFFKSEDDLVELAFLIAHENRKSFKIPDSFLTNER